MNKRFSTLLGASLLLSSAFSVSVAENLAGAVDEANAGKTYKIVRSAQTTNPSDASTWSDACFAEGNQVFLSMDKDGKIEFVNKLPENVQEAYWTVSEGQIKGTFVLTNGIGKVLEFDGNKAFYTEDYKDDAIGTISGEQNLFTLSLDKTPSASSHLQFVFENNSFGEIGYGLTSTSGVVYSALFHLEEVEASEVGDEELNSFFNKKGFNLAVKYDDKKGKLAENIFGGDSRIYAFEVNADNIKETVNEAKDEENKVIGYLVSEGGANGKDLIIPNGMYFFTNRVLKNASATDIKAEDIDWLASEFITVSPRETVEATVDDRAKGQGFKLVSVKGSEFIYEKNTSVFKVADNPIWNACFSVSDNYSGYPYAINLNTFYFQKSSKDAATDELEKTSVGLAVLAFDAVDTQYLTSKPDAKEYIFKFSDSALKDGKELLKTTKEAAVYNLQFVAGKTSTQKLLVGKYLTIANSGSNFEWVAKPYDITKVEHPAFQYTITNVKDEDPDDDVEKYTIITFTNRETDKSFIAKLFPEPSYGENCYSLAFVDKDGKDLPVGQEFEVDPLKVNSNNYAVEYYKNGTTPIVNVDVTEDVIVKLIPAKVDEYAGFLNVATGTVRTIRYARDKFDTSYQWYTNVKTNDNGGYELSDKFVEDNYDAAQFYLVRSEKPSTIARTFVYNNETTKDVDDVPNGDKLSAYTYQLRYIADGTVSGYGLNTNSSNNELTLLSNKDNWTNYYIRENADGSVSFFNEEGDNDDTFKSGARQVTSADEKNSVQVVVKDNDDDDVKYAASTEFTYIYKATSLATDIRTFLEGEAPVFSWPAENGHVSLRNNTTGVIGNYISMNDSREGILVSNDADAFYLQAADKNAVVPSFFISKGKGKNSNASSERMYMFNPVDSVKYPVNMDFDPNYQLAKSQTKAIFKAGKLNDNYTKLNTWIKGENRDVAMAADNNGVWGGLNRFKFQIIETADHDGNYNVRQVAAIDGVTAYLASTNEKLYFTKDKALAMTINVESVEAPTSNEGVAASEVKVVAQNGSVVVKNAAGKNVVVSTILGQVVANEVLTSDNATINVPAGIVVVAVDGESFKVNVK